MSDPTRWQAAPAAKLAWDDGEIPRSEAFDDVYYSAQSGVDESRHVFLQANRLDERWADWDSPRFTIAETGFGSGLNFLCAWQLWREQEHRPHTLHYLSVEKFPLRRNQLRRALGAWPDLKAFSSDLLDNYPPPLPGQHRLVFEQGRVILDLVFADAEQALEQWQQDSNLCVDAWFLDGFAPSCNPQMWSQGLFNAMGRLSAPGTTFATFTAAGQVRRDLTAAGFTVEKVAGFAYKREMARGEFTTEGVDTAPRLTPWHLVTPETVNPRSALVLGAGLAGCSIAFSLARRGWTVRILDAGRLAEGASGNRQGVLYTRLSHRSSPLSQFALHSFCYALRLYRDFMDRGLIRQGIDGEFCGALHLKVLDAEDPLRQTASSLPELVRYLDATEAAACSGLAPCSGGLLFPDAGWLNPPAVCRALVQHPKIELLENCGPLTLRRTEGQWQALDAGGNHRAEASVAVVACGTNSPALDFGLDALDWLPLQSIRGQVTHLPSTPGLANLKTVICHDGYISPARENAHCIGATFSLDDDCSEERASEHSDNMDKLQKALDIDLSGIDRAQLRGRVAYRCASADYLPLAGPVPELRQFKADYAGLRKNARRVINKRHSFIPGLWLSAGHGSRGLTSTPLSAELIASQICGEPWPLEMELVRALAPARFIIRDLIRNRV